MRRSGGCGGAAGAAERWVRRSGGCGGAAGAAAGAAGAAGASAAVSDAGAAVSEAEAVEAVEAVEAAAEAAKSMAPADSGGSGKCTGTGYPDGPRAATGLLIEAVRMILQRSLMHYSGQRHHKSMRHYTIDGGITVVYEAFLLSGVRLQELRRLASASSFRAVRWLWGVVCERGGVSHVSVGQSSAAVRDGRKR